MTKHRQRTCGRCGKATPFGLAIPKRLGLLSDWQVFYCAEHRADAEAARDAEIRRLNLGSEGAVGTVSEPDQSATAKERAMDDRQDDLFGDVGQ